MRSDTEAHDPLLDGRTSRRGFLRGALGAATPFALAAALGQATERAGRAAQTAAAGGPHKLPPLPYAYGALEPHIDARTMQIHHDRHHAAYVNNLNAALKEHPDLRNKSAEQLIRDLDSVPESIRTAVRNNGGGHVNHTMFWTIMRPRGGGPPRGAIAQAINGTFGSFAKFQNAFNDAGAKRFGSGWVWLAHSKEGKLQVLSTPNQDNPLMEGHYPILGNDVWEHAYYLKYQNRRPDYLKAWWNTVNWDAINRRFAAAQRSG